MLLFKSATCVLSDPTHTTFRDWGNFPFPAIDMSKPEQKNGRFLCLYPSISFFFPALFQLLVILFLLLHHKVFLITFFLLYLYVT